MQNLVVKPFKKLKGGLAQLITTVFLLIVAVLVFYSAIHPSAGVIKDKGVDAGTQIMIEDESMKAEFTPYIFE